MSLSPFPFSSLTTVGKQAAAAGLLAQKVGPYVMLLGLTKAVDGVTSEPVNGVSGYNRQTVTLTATNGEISVGASTWGTFTANLGAACAFSIHAASGEALICEWFEQERMMDNGQTFSFVAGQIKLVF